MRELTAVASFFLFFFFALDDRADFMMVCVFCNGVIRHRGQRCVNASKSLIIPLKRRRKSRKTYPETRLDLKSVQVNRLFFFFFFLSFV